jgi:hypothetical protein
MYVLIKNQEDIDDKNPLPSVAVSSSVALMFSYLCPGSMPLGAMCTKVRLMAHSRR